MATRLRHITLPRLHPGQLEAARSAARFRLLACGRRWGKTKLCAHEAVKGMLEQKRVWHVAPTYSIGAIGFRDMVMMGRQVPGVRIQMGAKTLAYGARGSIEIKSADYPNNLRGEGLDLLILDEAAFMPENTWVTILRPALMDKQGRALLASSPNGKNWFYNAYKSDLFESWQRPSWTSPFLSPEEIETMRATLTKAQFAQEVAAEFVDFQGRVFPIPRVLPPITSRKEAVGKCVFGIAIGRSPSASAVAIAPVGGHRVWCVNQTQMDYAQQMDWLASMIAEWQPSVVVLEEKAVGAPMRDMVQRVSRRLVPYTATQRSTVELIDSLINSMEKDSYALPDQPAVVNQFETYTCTRTPLGAYTFGPPDGLTDDAVCATLMVRWAQWLEGQNMRAFRI